MCVPICIGLNRLFKLIDIPFRIIRLMELKEPVAVNGHKAAHIVLDTVPVLGKLAGFDPVDISHLIDRTVHPDRAFEKDADHIAVRYKVLYLHMSLQRQEVAAELNEIYSLFFS
jgi:hypothetical protein